MFLMCVPHLVCLWLLLQTCHASPRPLSWWEFSRVLGEVMEKGLGFQAIQAEFQKHGYEQNPISGGRILTDLTEVLSHKLREKMDALRRLQEVIEAEYPHFALRFSKDENDPLQRPQCCNSNLKQKRNTEDLEACEHTSRFATQPLRFATEAVTDVMKANRKRVPSLKWQYFGSTEGVLLSYPAYALNYCDYDPRFRPWYVQTVIPVPKDVILIIDTSSSMNEKMGEQTKIDVAREAAITVINTTNSNDRIGIVGFGDNAYTPGKKGSHKDCFSWRLASATSQVKDCIRHFITEMEAMGATDYGKAFTKAFELISNSTLQPEDQNRATVMLFLTDGIPSAGLGANAPKELLELVRNLTAKQKTNITIMTYGIGIREVDGIKLLQELAQNIYNEDNMKMARRGWFTPVQNLTNLVHEMARYYDAIKEPKRIINPVITEPYHDFIDLSVITSICLPIYSGGNIVGATCTDIYFGELLEEVMYFEQQKDLYTFLITRKGWTLVHPLLPEATTSMEHDPVLVDISQLERGDGMKRIIDSMKRGETGSKELSSATRVVSRGKLENDGVRVEVKPSSYHWGRLNDSDFSLCIVHTKDAVLLVPHERTSRKFKYHRIDWTDSTSEKCRHFLKVVNFHHSSVKISPGAFQHPYHYLENVETNEDVEKITKYMLGQSEESMFKRGIRATVALTDIAEDIWMKEKDLSQYLIWRYIATTNGVMHFYPSSVVYPEYDHRKRPWYRFMLAQHTNLGITSPYQDVFGGGALVSMCQKIRRVPQDPSSHVLALVCGDFSLPYFNSLVITAMPECNSAKSNYSCIVIETSGFVVLHDDFLNWCGTESKPELYNVHITAKEPQIAEHLIQNNLMRREGCINLKTLRVQYFWVMANPTDSNVFPFGGLDNLNGSPSYEIRAVPRTNLFVIRKRKGPTSRKFKCDCYPESVKKGEERLCKSENSTICQCPCASKIQFDHCTNTLQEGEGKKWPLCFPKGQLFDRSNFAFEMNEMKHLKNCVNYQCQEQTTSSDCYARAGCSWHKCDARGNRITPNCTDGMYPVFTALH